jgi:hypothetical protein
MTARKKTTRKKAVKKKATKKKATKKKGAKKKAAKKKATRKKAAKKKPIRKNATRKKATTRRSAKKKVAKKATNVAPDPDDRMVKVASLLASADWDTVLVGCALFRSLDDDQLKHQLISAIEPAHVELAKQPASMCVHTFCDYLSIDSWFWENFDSQLAWAGGATTRGNDWREIYMKSDSVEDLAWAMVCMRENYWDPDNCGFESWEDRGGGGEEHTFFHFDANQALSEGEPELDDSDVSDGGDAEIGWVWSDFFLPCSGDPSWDSNGKLAINDVDVEVTKARPLLCALALIAGVDFDRLPALDAAAIRAARDKEYRDFMKPANLKKVFAR